MLGIRFWFWAEATDTCTTTQAGQSSEAVGTVSFTGQARGSNRRPPYRPPFRYPAFPPQPASAPPVIIPAIYGSLRSAQAPALSALVATLGINGELEQFQPRQDAMLVGDVIDVELEMIAAILMEVA